ncbi:SGNH hydrolase-type esterase domain-containing protein [Tanacetum coccineum]
MIFSTDDVIPYPTLLLFDHCTSAAPTYFSPHYFVTKDADASRHRFDLINGGVAANNPQYRNNQLNTLVAKKAAGINPFPHEFQQTISILEFSKEYEYIEKGKRLEEEQKCVAGKETLAHYLTLQIRSFIYNDVEFCILFRGQVRNIRSSSRGLFFYDLHGGGSKIQILADQKEVRELVLEVMPHQWDRQENTMLKLAHFERKAVKKTPAKTSSFLFHKPDENHPLGKDSSKKISNLIGKAADFANSAKTKKFYFDFSMTYLGAGMICSHLVSLSLLAGALLSYRVMWPLIGFLVVVIIQRVSVVLLSLWNKLGDLATATTSGIKSIRNSTGRIRVIIEQRVKDSQKARILELKRRNYEEHYSDIIYVISINYNSYWLMPLVAKMKVIKKESEALDLLMINDDLFSYDTPLRMIFDKFGRLSGMNDDLFTYEVGNPVLSSIPLIDVIVDEWLELKYGDQSTISKEVKENVIGTWLVQSYKKQFKEYMELKKQWETFGLYTDVLRDPSNAEFSDWLASKFNTHMTMDWYSKNALWLYWKKEDDEEVITDDELSNPGEGNLIGETEIVEFFRIETDIFQFETPLSEAFKEFNYLLKIDVDVLTNDI